MSHKYFTHKDAMRQEIPLSLAPTPDEVANVRNIICGNAINADEAAQLLDMLAIPLPERVTM